MGYLYRGVDKQHDLKCEGRLRPKGIEYKTVVKIGTRGLKVDGTFIVGNSEENVIRLHQLDIERERWCMVSTSRDENVAVHFATNGNLVEGYVYTIDENLLESYGVKAHERNYPENIHESEITLRAQDMGDLPMEIVISKREVKPS